MRRLMLLLAIYVVTTGMTFGQHELATEKEYDRFVRERLQMDFRNFVLNNLNLNKDQIVSFDPLLDEYMDQKVRIAQQKLTLLENYSQEVKKFNQSKNQKKKTIDFIKAYWETEIAEMRLKKNYFDRFEDKIPYQKALEFFFLEDEVQYKMVEPWFAEVAPILKKFEKLSGETVSGNKMRTKEEQSPTAYEQNDTKIIAKTKRKAYNQPADSMEARYAEDAVNDYAEWLKISDAEVSVDHQYTHDGLNKLATAMVALHEAEEIAINKSDLKQLKKVRLRGDRLKKEPESQVHAEIARNAFILISRILESAQTDERFTETKEAVASVASAARMIEVDRPLIEQSATVYTFFDLAEKAINQLRTNAQAMY